MARVADNGSPIRGRGRSPLSLVLVTLAGAALALLLHPAMGLPIAGAALAGLTLSRRHAAAVSAIIVGSALATVLAAQTMYTVGVPLTGVEVPDWAPFAFAAMMGASFAVVGPVAAQLLQRRPALETVFTLTVLLSGAQLVTLAVFAASVGQSLGAYVSAATASLATQAGMGTELAEVLTAVWPGALITTTGFTGLFTVLAVGLAGARQGRPLNRIPALPTLDLDPRTVLLPIAAIALLAAGRLSGSQPVASIGENVLIVARWVFFLQGISVFAGLYQKVKVSGPLRVVGFVCLGVTEAFAPLVSLTGLADVWINIRRLPREGAVPGEPKATSGVD